MGYSLCKIGDFKNLCHFSNICCFFERFFPQNDLNVLIEWFFACSWHFQFLTQTDNFAKAIAFAWAIAFARSAILKICLISRIFGVFSNGFLHRTTLILLQNGFSHVFGIFNF